MLADPRSSSSRGQAGASERESRPFDFCFAENRIVDFVEMSRFQKIGIAHEVAASAHDMSRHSRRLQPMLGGFGLLLTRPTGDRLLQIRAIAQPADDRVELRLVQFPTYQGAQSFEVGWSRGVD